MTLSSPAPRRPRRRRRLAAVLAAAVALVAAVPVAAWSATLGVDAPPQLMLTVAPIGNGVISPGESAVVTVALENPTDAGADAGAVRVSTSATPLSTRDELVAWLSGGSEAPDRTGSVVAETAVPAVAAGDRSATNIPLDDAAVTSLAAGVYPVRADYVSGDETLSALSVLVVQGEATPGALAVIVPITAPALTAGLLTSDELSTLTADDGSLRRRLDAVTGSNAILAVDPAIVAAIRVLGTTAPASAQQWLDDLLALPNSRFPLQFGDADLAAQRAAGVAEPLQVATLAPYLAANGFADAVASPTPGVTPSPGSTATAPTLPTLDQLTDIGGEGRTVYWPATGTAGASLVAALAVTNESSATQGDATPVTLVDSTAVTGGGGAWASAGDAPVIVYDADVSASLRDAAAQDAPVARSASLAAASAYAALRTSAAPDVPLAVTIDRPAEISATGLRAAVLAAGSLGGRTAVGLRALTSGTPAPVTLADVTTSAEDAARVGALLSDEERLTAFSPVLIDPEQLTARERASILQLIGNAWTPSDASHADAYEAHRAQTTATLASVGISPPTDITLATSGAPLTFAVRNDLPWPIGVVLITSPDDPRLVVQTTTPVDGGAAQTSRVRVPVEARVASGESTLTLQLQTPSGMPVGDPVQVHVAVRAEWESVGIIVMVIAVVALIGVGAFRTIRRLRRRAHEEDGEGEGDIGPDAGTARATDAGGDADG